MKYNLASFYSIGTPYEQVIQEYLLSSLKKYPEISPLIIEAKNYGSWRENVAQKPSIIREILYNTQIPLVFLDADATIEQYPILFEEIPDKYDIAFHTLDWATWYGYKDCNMTELLTGTLWLNNNAKIKSLCKDWGTEAFLKDEWEQKSLERIIKGYDLNIYPLPLEYCYIDTFPNGTPPIIKCDNVVITHHQVSRKLKKIIRKDIS